MDEINIAPYLNILPPLLPIPSLNRHIIAPRQHNRQRRMHRQTTNIIRMRLKRRHLLVRIVVEHAQLVIVGPSDEPVLPRDEFRTSHRHLCDLERFDQRPCIVVVDVHVAIVQRGEQPGLGWVEIDGLDAVRARKELFLQLFVRIRLRWCWDWSLL